MWVLILERKYSGDGIVGLERAAPQEGSPFGRLVRGGRRRRRGLWSLLELQPGPAPQVAVGGEEEAGRWAAGARQHL